MDEPGQEAAVHGCEFGQLTEWNHDGELAWPALTQDHHRGVQGTVRALNQAYRDEPALHQLDADPSGFQWVVGDDRVQSVFAYLRFGKGGSSPVLVICNFTPTPLHGYRVGVPEGRWREILNTDAAGFGGSDTGNSGVIDAAPHASHGQSHSIELTLPPLATIILHQER